MFGNIKYLHSITRAVANSSKAILSVKETLTAATVHQLTVPVNATSARISISADSLSLCKDATKLARYWTSGATPTATEGFIVSHMDEIVIDGKQQMSAFKIIESDLLAGGTETIELNIQFYRE